MGYLWPCQVVSINGKEYPRNEDFQGGLFLFLSFLRWKSTREVEKLNVKSLSQQYNRLRKRFDEYERFKKEQKNLTGKSLNEVENLFKIRIFIWKKGCKKSAPKCLKKGNGNPKWPALNFLSERHGDAYLR